MKIVYRQKFVSEFNNKEIRDLIFKGYVVPYKIDTDNNQIIIIGVNKYKAQL